MVGLVEYLSAALKGDRPVNSAKLREDLFKAVVQSYPKNTYIPIAEFSKALGIATDSSGIYVIINRLLAKYEVSRKYINRRPVFTVLVPPNQYEKEREQGLSTPMNIAETTAKPTAKPTAEPVAVPTVEPNPTNNRFAVDRLEQQAMRYKFYYPSGDIAGFLLWLKGEQA